jgi:molecular chaperone DnaJ
MRLQQDYYEVLGVAREATDDEIKKAFRGLARSLHPDVSADPEEGRFHEVVTAYHVLSHPRRRSLYDRLGLGGRRREPAGPAPAVPPIELDLEWWEAERGASKPVEFEDTAQCAECLGRGIPRGVSAAVCIACHGSGRINEVRETAELRLLQVHRCSVCSGKGQDVAIACIVCGGSGKTTEPTTIRLRTPAGVEDGDLLQVDGIAQRFLLRVGPRPRDSRLVLAASALALLCAVGLLLFLLLR